MATIVLLTEEKSITTNDRNRWLNYEKKPEPTPSIFTEKGYNVVEMWECEWRQMKKTNRELQRFIAKQVRRTLDTVKIMSEERMLSEVRHKRLFGCVDVDIRVPDHLKEKFSEMCPIFKNTEISRDDILS